MAITSYTYKYIRPKSVDDSNYEEFEYLLAWYGRNGAYHQKMFTDHEQENDIDGQPLNLKDEDYIQSLIQSEERQIMLTAENLTYNDYIAMTSIMVATRIIRVYKTGGTLATDSGNSFERVTIVPGSWRIRKTDLRYNLSFSILLRSIPLAA